MQHKKSRNANYKQEFQNGLYVAKADVHLDLIKGRSVRQPIKLSKHYTILQRR